MTSYRTPDSFDVALGVPPRITIMANRENVHACDLDIDAEFFGYDDVPEIDLSVNVQTYL